FCGELAASAALALARRLDISPRALAFANTAAIRAASRGGPAIALAVALTRASTLDFGVAGPGALARACAARTHLAMLGAPARACALDLAAPALYVDLTRFDARVAMRRAVAVNLRVDTAAGLADVDGDLGACAELGLGTVNRLGGCLASVLCVAV